VYQVGIDIGGTFTDAVLVTDGGEVSVAKVPTTPADLRDCFLHAIDAVSAAAQVDSGADLGELRRIVHGTTVATNVMVQHAGAATALLTTRGFSDTIHIMQGHGYTVGIPDEMVTRIQELEKPAPIIPKHLIRGVPERIDASGTVLVALDEAALREQIAELLDEGAESFAICFLWSFVNDAHERRAREIVSELAPDAFVCISSEVSARIGEYNRTVATAINAYVGPATSRYVGGLEADLAQRNLQARLSILQCSGGVVSPEEARQSPVRLIGSGPVGGTVASQTLGAALQERNLIACDMGGTSFDVSVVADGELVKQSLGVIDQYEYAVPSVEIQSIGAGGGSVVWLDEGTGTLRVGPHSAGSLPGPASYGRGGTLPTVTDCDLIVGYLSEAHTLAGGLKLDLERAVDAVRTHVADPLGLSVVQAAQGALRIVDTQMAELIRQLTVGRGMDPRDFVLFAFGGAGPLHAPVFAGELGVKYVVIPRGEVASLWSAFGAVSGDVVLPLEQFYAGRAPFDAAAVQAAFAELERAGTESILTMGVARDEIGFRRFVDLRYGAQVHVLSVPVPGELDDEAMEQVLTDFDALYEARNGPGTGYRDAGVEMTAIRVEVVGRAGRVPLAAPASNGSAGTLDLAGSPTRTVHWSSTVGSLQTPIVHAGHLAAGQSLRGPAVIELETTTVPVRPGDALRIDAQGNFVLDLGSRR
jgi:N-methylhydantoinase A